MDSTITAVSIFRRITSLLTFNIYVWKNFCDSSRIRTCTFTPLMWPLCRDIIITHWQYLFEITEPLVAGTRIELVFREWKSRVLTDRRTRRYLGISPNFVIPMGLEPMTPALKVPCSTDWATRSYQILSILSWRF